MTATRKDPPRVVLLPGDGIGPEIVAAVRLIFDRCKVPLHFQEALIGARAIRETGSPMPDDTIELVRSSGIALKGPVETPIGQGFRSVNVSLRQKLELYANLRPVKSIPGIESRYQDIDLVFIRENTEGLYSGLEHEIVPGVVTSLKVSTRTACTRIAEFAFRYAESSGRKKITAVHKANILKLSDGLALVCYREVANRYPNIEYEEKIVDAVAMELVRRPERFDILLMENLYGDILSDLGAGLIGGLGLAPSANFGAAVAVFEAVHGTAPDIAGRGIANPIALLLSATQMLRHIGEREIAGQIERATFAVCREKRLLTPDLGGSGTTLSLAEAIAERSGRE